MQELADSVLHRLQSRVEFRSTDQLVTPAQLRAVSGGLVEATSVVAVENELLRKGKLSRGTASNGLQVYSHDLYVQLCVIPACIVYKNMCTQVIKFIAAEESGPVCVSEMDKGILRLIIHFIRIMC